MKRTIAFGGSLIAGIRLLDRTSLIPVAVAATSSTFGTVGAITLDNTADANPKTLRADRRIKTEIQTQRERTRSLARTPPQRQEQEENAPSHLAGTRKSEISMPPNNTVQNLPTMAPSIIETPPSSNNTVTESSATSPPGTSKSERPRTTIAVRLDDTKPSGLAWDNFSLPDPYVVVDGESFRGARCEDNLSCSWNLSSVDEYYDVAVYEADLSGDDYVGTVRCRNGYKCDTGRGTTVTIFEYGRADDDQPADDRDDYGRTTGLSEAR